MVRPRRSRRRARLVRLDVRRRRVYVCGLRFHHGLAGLLAAVAGVAAMVHDAADFPWSPLDDVW